MYKFQNTMSHWCHIDYLHFKLVGLEGEKCFLEYQITQVP